MSKRVVVVVESYFFREWWCQQRHLRRFFISHFNQFRALPPRGIGSAHRKEQLMGIRSEKRRLEFLGLQRQLVSPLPRCRPTRSRKSQKEPLKKLTKQESEGRRSTAPLPSSRRKAESRPGAWNRGGHRR